MEKLTLSLEELSFAILIESHNVVCRYLFDYVMSSIKAGNPEKWKDIICSCFSVSLKDHVKKRLESNLPFTDFYSVCKLLRCRINDVANFCGKSSSLDDPHEKERLSLQIQGVETARHWAFHEGLCVSPEEVRSSIGLILAILNTLSEKCGSAAPVSISEKVSQLFAYTEILRSGKEGSVYTLGQSTITSALFFSGLRELQKNFHLHFQETAETREGTDNSRPSKRSRFVKVVEKAVDFACLVKPIKKALTEKRNFRQLQKQVGRDNQQADYLSMCNNVLAARNALAHSEKLTLTQIGEALSGMHGLLSLFQLSCEDVLSTLKRLPPPDNENKRNWRGPFIQCQCSSFELPQTKLIWSRILRPKSYNFVGREEEISNIKSVLIENPPGGIKAVLIFGQAGIGKSFLASEIADSLTSIFRAQSWLSCSTIREFQQDLLHSSLSCFREGVFSNQNGNAQNKGVLLKACVKMKQLVVLDDVCSSAMHCVWKLIEETGHSVIITTRSSGVKRFLRQMVQALTVINLTPFSLVESWALLAKKANVSTIDEATLALVKSTLSGVLGNLPLCVSIYSSLVAFISKRSSNATSLESLSVSTGNWKKIEERFGDRFHIRGLTGIIQSTETYLQDHPLVVFLLVKICSVDANIIPWEILRQADWRRLRVKTYRTNLPWLDDLVDGLLGVTDWLFSEGGQSTLETCRDTLEELGIIGWNSASSTVLIHSLTLRSILEMLQSRALFLDILASKVIHGIYAEGDKFTFLTRHLFQCLAAELAFHVINRSLNMVREATKNFPWPQNKIGGKSFFAIGFLLKIIDGDTGQLLKELLTSTQSGFLSDYLIMLFDLRKLKDCAILQRGFKVTNEKADQGLKHSEASSQDRKKVEVGNACTITLKHGNGSHAQVNEHFELAMDYSSDKYHSMNVDLFAEAMKRKGENGSNSRAMSLLQVSQRLGITATLTEPTADKLRCKIADVISMGQCQTSVEYLKYFINKEEDTWCAIVLTKLFDSLEEIERVDEETLEMALLLITLSQQRQHVLSEAFHQQSVILAENVQTKNTLIHVLLSWECKDEASLWIALNRPGRALRVYMRNYYAIETQLFEYLSRTPVEFHGPLTYLWRSFQEIVQGCSFYSLEVGWFPGITKYPKTFHKKFKRFQEDAQLECNEVYLVNEVDENYSGRDLYAVCSLTEEIQTIFERQDFQAAVPRLLTLLEDFVNSELKKNPGHVSYVPEHVFDTLNYLTCLCSLLGRARTQKPLTVLQNLSETYRITGLTGWLDQVTLSLKLIVYLTEHSEVCTLTDYFMESVQAFAAGDFPHARKASLRFLREITDFLEVTPIRDIINKVNGFTHILRSMLLRVAHNLQQLYAKELKHDVAEWFLKFRWENSQHFQWYFLAGEIGVEYVEFLKERGRFCEALGLSRLVGHVLVDEFGDDYEEWLPEAPNLKLTIQELDILMQQISVQSSVENPSLN